MRKGVAGVRRMAAILSVSVVMLLVTGTGAGAAVTPKLSWYTAMGEGKVLNVHLQLPSALKPVLQAASLSNVIDETVSFSRSIGQDVPQATVGQKVLGTGLGQMFNGSLDTVLATVAGRALPKVVATIGKATNSLGVVSNHDSLAEVDLPGVATPLGNLVHIGVAEVNAKSDFGNVAGSLKAIVSHSDSKLLGIKVALSDALTSQLKSLLQPVLDKVDGTPGTPGLIDQINAGLNTVETTVQQKLGITVNLDLPKLESLLNQPLATIGVIETGSDTGFAGAARNANAITRMADIDLFGSGSSALVHIDSLSTDTGASIDGTRGGAASSAVNRIVGLRILGNAIDLTKGALTINGKPFALPTTVLDELTTLLQGTLGLHIDLFGASHGHSATHAWAKAETLNVGLALLAGTPLETALSIGGPGSSVDVQGGSVSPLCIGPSCSPLPTTGVPTTMYFVIGTALLGMTVLVRRFALSR